MNESMTIELPLPHISLHPNSRPHWATKARMVKRCRGEACLMAKAHKLKSCPWQQASIHMTYYMPRRRDNDGLIAWGKAIFDGLQDAGVVLNDSAFRTFTVDQVIQKEERKVVLRIDRKLEGTVNGNEVTP